MVKIETKLPKEKKKSHARFTILLVFGILVIFTAAFGYWGYRTLMSPNVQTPDGKDFELFIPTGSNYEQVHSLLEKADILVNRKMLADLAVNDPEAFSVVVETAKAAL